MRHAGRLNELGEGPVSTVTAESDYLKTTGRGILSLQWPLPVLPKGERAQNPALASGSGRQDRRADCVLCGSENARRTCRSFSSDTPELRIPQHDAPLHVSVSARTLKYDRSMSVLECHVRASRWSTNAAVQGDVTRGCACRREDRASGQDRLVIPSTQSCDVERSIC